MSSRSVFFLGVTGYIGGSILAASWIKRYPQFTWTALIRNPKDVAAVKALGPNVKTVIGSLSDLELIEKHSRESDVVCNFANADELSVIEAIIKGLTDRAKSGSAKVKPIFLHTSGTGLVIDSPDGRFNEKTPVYDDNSVESIKSIPVDGPHRDVDLRIFSASEAGDIDAYIVAPATIYGKGHGPVRITSIQINALIRVALNRKEFVQVGDGTNQWDNVHLDEITDLYGLVFDFALSGKNTNKSYANFFWGSARTHAWGDINNRLARIMYKKGLVTSDKVRSVTLEEEPGVAVAAHNSRTVSNRSFALGWKPEGTRLVTDEDILEEEVDLTAAA